MKIKKLRSMHLYVKFGWKAAARTHSFTGHGGSYFLGQSPASGVGSWKEAVVQGLLIWLWEVIVFGFLLNLRNIKASEDRGPLMWSTEAVCTFLR